MPSSDADPALAFPVLVADIGGTNARFALLESPTSDLVVLPSVHTVDHLDPIAAIRYLQETHGLQHPRSAIMAIAAPVTGDVVQLTNSTWRIAPREMLASLALTTVIVINDFEALALALPAFQRHDLERIGPEIAPRPFAPMVVIGPGTGLGVAGLIHSGNKWIPVPGEGGHVSIGPETDAEARIWPNIDNGGHRLEAESVISGRGLLRLGKAVAISSGQGQRFDKPADVTTAAAEHDPVAIEALEIFAALVGRVAGDMGLTFLARGGVFIGGGVSLHVAAHLTGGAFRRAFDNKHPHERLVASMPTWLIRHDRPALLGLSAYARAPDSYGLDLAGRIWHA